MAVAPATGTPETGGWSTRELRTILRGLEGINLVAADIVEVAVSTYLALGLLLFMRKRVVHDTISEYHIQKELIIYLARV